MELRQIAPADRDPALVAALLAVWEASVRATHHFLSEAAIRQIAGYVPQALGEVPLLAVAYDAQGHAVGFMGAVGGHLGMLFLDPAARGRGETRGAGRRRPQAVPDIEGAGGGGAPPPPPGPAHAL